MPNVHKDTLGVKDPLNRFQKAFEITLMTFKHNTHI